MIKRLTYDYWMMILAWCMMLSDYIFIGICFSIVACALLANKIRERNNWRMCFVILFSYFVVLFILPKTNITYFFPKFTSFYLVVAINAGMTCEYLSKIKIKNLLPYLAFMIVGYSVLIIISLLLPNKSYSLFTKDSLYIMEAFIFLPYLIPVICFYINKMIKVYSKRNVVKQMA